MAKNKGAFAQVFRKLNEDGSKTDIIRARVTDDIVLKKGQTLFFDGFQDNIKALAARGIIDEVEASKRISMREELDTEYNQSTMYSLKAGDPNRAGGNNSNNGDSL